MTTKSKIDTMKAIVQDEYGTPEVLAMREVDRPAIASDRILVKVHVSSVNAMEWHMTTGLPMMARPSIGWRRPKSPIPGADIAGVVEAVGDDITAFSPGDEVFGEVGAGAWAEYAIGSERTLAKKPANVSFEAAGVLGVAALTALQGLRDHGAVEAGHHVLINGASGGVGTYAVQIAKAMGARVTAVCSTRNVEQTLELGADRVIDYSQERFVDSGETYDAVIDVVGLSPTSHVKKMLKPGGRHVFISGPKRKVVGPLPKMFRSILAYAFSNKSMKVFVAKVNKEDLVELGQMLADGQIQSVIEGRYVLTDAPKALAYLGEGHARAKNAILVG